MLFCRLQEHSRLSFAAFTGNFVGTYTLFRVMWAEVEGIDRRAITGKFNLDMFMEGPDRLLVKISSGHPSLVADDNHEEPGILETFDCLRGSGKEFKVFNFVEIILLDVDGAVAIEKDSPSFTGHQRGLNPGTIEEFC
jgi:hypothetical protein